MLTVKVVRAVGHSSGTSKIVEAEAVELFSGGPNNPGDDSIREIACVTRDTREVLYVASPPPSGLEETREFWDIGYIENANGRTIEVVRSRPTEQ